MKIVITRITKEHTQDCWICGEALWQAPATHWDRAREESRTDEYQPAFKLVSDTGFWGRWICDTCSYTDAADIREHVISEAMSLEEDARRLRAYGAELLISPTPEERDQENALIEKWNGRLVRLLTTGEAGE